MNIKKLIYSLFLLSMIVGFRYRVMAVTIPNPFAGDFLDNFTRITSVIRPATVLSFLGVVLWGGFTIETAGDNADKMSKGWKIILAGIIGFVVMIIAPSLPDFIAMIFGTEGLIDF
ncbi:hypothetical protein GF362_04425 [Candidatus Dojkabacteria bacterium]|nr:hypothetical protein [Candidatus Dojkabacteria bacterium]